MKPYFTNLESEILRKWIEEGCPLPEESKMGDIDYQSLFFKLVNIEDFSGIRNVARNFVELVLRSEESPNTIVIDLVSIDLHQIAPLLLIEGLVIQETLQVRAFL